MGLIEEFRAAHPERVKEAQIRRKALKQLLADYDKTLREQIAREIEAECERNHTSPYNDIVRTHGGEPFPSLCRCAKAAAIARGEK